MALDDGKVSAAYLQQSARQVHAVKELSYQRMAISLGDTVLDAGCGPGMDTVPLAQWVGTHGKVIGIDSDPLMLAEAERYAQQNNVAARISHQLGSALELQLADDSINSCRAERLLQVLPPSYEQPLLLALMRVTKPGGRIVLVDTDWGSASVDFSASALERRLMSFFATQMRPNGFAGRRLYAHCRQHGLRDITLDIMPLPQHKYEDTPFGKWLTDTGLQAGIITEREGRLWQEELYRRNDEGSFFACVNMVVVSACKPAS